MFPLQAFANFVAFARNLFSIKFHLSFAIPNPLSSVAMFETIAAQLITATDKLAHLRRFL
jgi:hypothetical protein